MEAPAELGITAVLVGAAGVVTHVQLVAALCHGRDSHVHLADNEPASTQVKGNNLSFFFFYKLCVFVPPLEQAGRRSTSYIRQALASGSQGEGQEGVLWMAKQNIRYDNVPTKRRPEAHLDFKLHPGLSPKGHVSFIRGAGLGQGT